METKLFKPRLEIPEKGNKWYNKTPDGVSRCILGKPTVEGLNCLANCVGYASGRWGELLGTTKYSYICRAEAFFESGIRDGLQVSDIPALGAYMVWAKGDASTKKDGSGHVSIVEKIYSKDDVLTSESQYNGTPFTVIRRKKENGNWGKKEGDYTFLGFVYPPITFIDESDLLDRIYVARDYLEESINILNSVEDIILKK